MFKPYSRVFLLRILGSFSIDRARADSMRIRISNQGFDRCVYRVRWRVFLLTFPVVRVDSTVCCENKMVGRVEFTGVPSAEITRNAAFDSAKLKAISMIISRMGAKIAQDIERGMEMHY